MEYEAVLLIDSGPTLDILVKVCWKLLESGRDPH